MQGLVPRFNAGTPRLQPRQGLGIPRFNAGMPGHIVELPVPLSNRQPTEVIGPGPATITMDLAADDTVEQLGSFAAGNGHTLGAKRRLVFPVPNEPLLQWCRVNWPAAATRPT